MRIWGCVVATFLLVLSAPALADASTTIGTTTAPAGSTAGACPTPPPHYLLLPSLTAGGLNSAYQVPGSVPQSLTQWQIDAAGASAGAQAELAVLQVNFATASVNVVGTDTETLNAADGVETFTLASPITVEPGDVLSLFFPGGSSPGITCYWSGGSGTAGDSVQGSPLNSAPLAGQQISADSGAGLTENSAVLDVAATLTPLSYDAGLSLSAGPANPVVGQPAELTATVTNHGPVPGPIAFTDSVQSGLTIEYAGASSGSCTTTAATNVVSCTSPSVPAGQSAKVVIVVTPTRAQSYADAGVVGVATGATDPDSANNNATVTVTAHGAGGPVKCIVPKLGRQPVAVAKKLLSLLGCAVGKAKTAHSKSVAKGLVIRTSPGAGSYTLNRAIALQVSSGPAKKKKKKTKHAARIVRADASADVTLGTVSQPTSSADGTCATTGSGGAFAQQTAASPLVAIAPTGSYTLTQWQVNETGGTAGAPVTLLVLQPSGADFTVVATDTEALPAPSGSPAIATFTPSTPVEVPGGDQIGLYATTDAGIACDWFGGTVPSGDTIAGMSAAAVPTVGETLSGVSSSSGFLVNLAATLVPTTVDTSVTMTSGPSYAAAGQPAVFEGTIANSGPGTSPVTFTDPVPAGFTVDAATASPGSCTVSAVNVVTCSVSELSPGQRSHVVIVATPKSAGSYKDTGDVAVPTGITDTDAANNTAATTLNVTAPGTALKCVVPKLGGASSSLAKQVLPLLGCKVGKTKKAHSKSVAKGLLIGTSPGAGTYAAYKAVGLEVSSGPAPKKAKKVKKKKK